MTGNAPRRCRLPRLALALALLAAALPGCAATTGRQYRAAAAALAASAGMAPVTFDTGSMRLAGYARLDPARPSPTLVVYLEGDGHAFDRPDAPATDPTPADPLGLALSTRDPRPKVLSLARPGQYLPPGALAACDPLWWTLGRYGPAVIAATSAALDQAKARYGASRLRLVGYSGGGALAVLVAAGRSDVAEITTLAANLDTDAWTTLHGVTPLLFSRNPADAARAVAGIPQTHYAGSKDTVTPPWLCRRFVARMPAGSPARCLVIEGAGHHAGLVAAWERIVGAAGP